MSLSFVSCVLNSDCNNNNKTLHNKDSDIKANYAYETSRWNKGRLQIEI